MIGDRLISLEVALFTDHFEYYIIFFKIKNRLASFKEYINKIFAKKLNNFVIVYLKHVFICINDGENSYIIVVW